MVAQSAGVRGGEADSNSVLLVGVVVWMVVGAATPPLALGVVASMVRHELAIGPGQLGIAGAMFYGASAVSSASAARWADRVSLRQAFAAVSGVLVASMLALSLCDNAWQLATATAIGGVGYAIAQPAANIALSSLGNPRRLGLLLGFKQAAIPIASMLSALLIPVFTHDEGWREIMRYAALAIFVLGVAGMFPLRPAGQRNWSTPRSAPRPSGSRSDLSYLIRGHNLRILVFGAACGAAACTALGLFAVDYLVENGWSIHSAGLLVGLYSGLGIVVRVGLGLLSDRWPELEPFAVIAVMGVAGGLGFAVLSLKTMFWVVIGTGLGYTAGWSWQGLAHLAVVRYNCRAVGRATGVLQFGLSIGAASGPLIFGWIAAISSYVVAWLVAGGLGISCGLSFARVSKVVRRHAT